LRLNRHLELGKMGSLLNSGNALARPAGAGQHLADAHRGLSVTYAAGASDNGKGRKGRHPNQDAGRCGPVDSIRCSRTDKRSCGGSNRMPTTSLLRVIRYSSKWLWDGSFGRTTSGPPLTQHYRVTLLPIYY